MKNFYIIILLISILGFARCHDVMDVKSPGIIVPEDMWNSKEMVEAYMYEVYFTLQDAGFDEQKLSSATDETIFTHGYGFRETNAGAVTEQAQGWVGKEQSGHQWKRLYIRTRYANDIIANIDNATFAEKDKKQLKGEAYFFRAFILHRLTRAFGGVPIQTKFTKLDDSDEQVYLPRNTYTECIEQMLKDIDVAAECLSDKTINSPGFQQGRLTIAAVEALRTRVLTDAASDLHDKETASKKSTVLASYANPELIFYDKGTREDRWRAVKEAALKLIMDPYGHELPTYGGTGLSSKEKSDKIWEHFLIDTNAKDHIFYRDFSFEKGDSGASFPRFNASGGFKGYGGNTPIQQMVDAYLMADGTEFDWNNPEHAKSPYKNREARFYAAILSDGQIWMDRPTEYKEIDPLGQMQTGYYQLDPAQEREKYYNGIDTRTGLGQTWNCGFTGYYIRKFINPRNGNVGERTSNRSPIIRLTEVYMHYIEACIELNELGEARKYLNQLRNNLGLPDVSESATQEELRKIHRNNSHTEFFLEDHRYWNVRRWMIAPDLEGHKEVRGIDITAKLKPGVGKQERYEYDESRWDYTYKSFVVPEEKRQWFDKLYYVPIHFDEMSRNTNLIQNPGYRE